MATPASNAATLRAHLCVGQGRGGGTKCLTFSRPLRLILLPGDKHGIQAWWHAYRGETDAEASITNRRPGLRPASLCQPRKLIKQYSSKPAAYCEQLEPKRKIQAQQYQELCGQTE